MVAAGTVTAAANYSPMVSASSSCNQTIRRRSRARARAIVGTPSSPSIPPPLGLGLQLRLGLQSHQFLAPWTGGGLLNTSPSFHHASHKVKKRTLRGKVVHASLFGVGAPEALVIGVVALLVFGPKGLAEVARNLGKTLRAFQPTIRELQDVSREFKNTLEREIGLDESASLTNNMYKPTSFSKDNQQAMVDPNGTPKSGAYTSEELLKITQEQLVASTAASAEPQSQESSPQEQQDASSKVTAASGAPDSAAQTQSSEKVDEER